MNVPARRADIERANSRIQTDDYPRTSAGVIALVADTFTSRQIPLPRAHIAILGTHAKALLEDGFQWETVAIAAATALRRGTPQHLQYIASDMVMASAGESCARRQYETMLQDMIELEGKR